MALPDLRPLVAEIPEPAPRRAVAGPAALLAFTALVVAMHLAAIAGPTGALWGVNAWAFLPRWMGIVAAALVALAAVPLVRTMGVPGPSRIVATIGLAGAPRARTWAWMLPAMLAAAAVLWLARARHVLLGDGIALLAAGLESPGLHELEPLTVAIQAGVHDAVKALAGQALTPRDLTATAAALVSVAAGTLFVPVAWALAGAIEGERPAARALVCVTLLLQGYAQLFCGYVENYAPLALANAIVLWTGIRCARGRGSLFAVGAAMALAVALHLAACALLPAFAALVLWSVVRGPARRRARIDLVALAALALALTATLAWLRPGYVLPATIWDVTVRAVGQRQEDPAYLLSLRHLGDFLNEHALIGPLSIFALAAGIAAMLARREGRRPDAAFVALAGLGCAAAAAVAGESNLGAARNWDLMAPAGVVLAAAGLFLLRPAFGAAWRPALLALAALSAFHTVPWIAVNASEARGVARFETLPLGHGRTENTIAFWHAERGDFAAAKRWIERSLIAEPRNHRAVDLLGRIAFEEGDAKKALQAYLIAITYRPDKAEYREQLARAVAAHGGPERSLEMLDALMVGQEDNAALWLERAMLLRAAGREAEAAAAKREALRLDVGMAAWADRLPAVNASASSARRAAPAPR